MPQFLKKLSYETWLKNHEPTHNDKWFRELYPYHLFQKIDFNSDSIGKEQTIEFNRIKYTVVIKKIELQENGRFRTTFDVSTYYPSQYLSWNNRSWNLTFQIVYSDALDFVTVFTKKEDPSKDYIWRFMKGNFDKISENKSLPVSELLFTTLLLELSERTFAGGRYKFTYEFHEKGVRELPEHPHFKREPREYTPLYSVERKQWICYSFMEEKAHRLAYYIANQCENLIVVYCNPTYTPHHKCKYDNVQIISLHEYSAMVSALVRREFETQIRFLQSHLNKRSAFDINELKLEIDNPKEDWYEIKKQDLLESISVMRIVPDEPLDILYTLAAMNLINAYLSQKIKPIKLSRKESTRFRRMYYFKTHLSNMLSELIKRSDTTLKIHISKDLVILEILDFQFSFHNMPKNKLLVEFESSDLNREIIWSGKRLQPIASLIFNYTQALRLNNN